jgi:hypothetical protein
MITDEEKLYPNEKVYLLTSLFREAMKMEIINNRESFLREMVEQMLKNKSNIKLMKINLMLCDYLNNLNH